MAINQGLRQGPMTSADTPPPHAPLQTSYTTASALCFVVYVLIPERQQSQKALKSKRKKGFLCQTTNTTTIKTVYLKQKHLALGRRQNTSPLTCCRKLLQPLDKIICIHLLQQAEWGYANERWQCYCARNINGVITVPCRAIGPSAAAPSKRASFLSRPLSGERWAVCSGEQS